ncbi:5554_t:CDS:2, partial [Racocetra fulgida]
LAGRIIHPSFGHLQLWGAYAFDDSKFDNDLAVKICMGLRPEFTSATPECYSKLAKCCMDSDPLKRPSASSIYEKIYNWCYSNDPEQEKVRKQFYETNEREEPFIVNLTFTTYSSEPINVRSITEMVYCCLNL